MTHYIFGFLESSQYTTISLVMFVVVFLEKPGKKKMMMKYTYNSNKKNSIHQSTL